MRYEDSHEKSAEYLRLALPLMSRQAAALHPVSYAVWYEYVSGSNRSLRSEVDDLTRNGHLLDEEQTYALHARHVLNHDEATARKVADGFRRVLHDIAQSASHAGEHASAFGESLETWCADFVANPDPAAVQSLLTETRRMGDTMGTLRSQLNDSQAEIERLKAEVSRAREDALIDALTGLTNRKGFEQALGNCLAAVRDGAPAPSLLMVDIDHFKNINDSYGHLFGDKVIRAVAQILKQNIKGQDVAARFGGEEFIVLLPGTPVEGASLLAERIRHTIEGSAIRRADSNQALAKVTVSLGVTRFAPGEQIGTLLARADEALYASKRSGRNRVTAMAA